MITTITWETALAVRTGLTATVRQVETAMVNMATDMVMAMVMVIRMPAAVVVSVEMEPEAHTVEDLEVEVHLVVVRSVPVEAVVVEQVSEVTAVNTTDMQDTIENINVDGFVIVSQIRAIE